MSDIFASVGSFISVSAALPATETKAGYEALTFLDIAEATDIPEHGAEQAIAKHVPLKSGITQKRGGSIDAGDFSLTFALSEDDVGQAALATKAGGAVTSDKRCAFKETYASGEVVYYLGLVHSYKPNIGGADDIAKATVGVAVTSASVVVPAV